MVRAVQIARLSEEINDSVYTSDLYPLLLDPSGQAAQFLRYRTRYLSILKRGDFEKESLRKGVLQALHNGAWLALDFEGVECDLFSMFDKDNFPEDVLSPYRIILEEVYGPLLRPSDSFSAKVTYEHQAALANGAFQDRTKCHAPERVADIDKRFNPKEAFRLIVMLKAEEAPPELASRLNVLKVMPMRFRGDSEEQSSIVWGGREPPKAQKSREQQKMDTDLLETAYDGELPGVMKLLNQGADLAAKDGRGNTALSEAACEGHLEVCRCLLDWKAPLGSNPNMANSDGRTSLHRAAFQGKDIVVQLLLERGADPRLKDRHGELPFDMASTDATSKVLCAWDVVKTDKMLEERRTAQDADDEKNVRNEEERLQLMRMKKAEKLASLIKEGDKDMLELELIDIDRAQLGAYRDDRGNNALHLAAEYGRLEFVELLIDEWGMDRNAREMKGWTPVAISAFRGHKKVCIALLQRKADPLIVNAYRKDALAVAQDDEIREVLRIGMDEGFATSSSGDPVQPVLPAATESPAIVSPASPKAKPKGKARAKSKSKAAAKSPSAKARGKSRPR
mmetsp:Transcript_97647/g.188311  ORF Transcript_97647/g.188311 Transcript_97647/m.188311 type:complete len:566 (-) Transcript_97647:108-1805(-)